MGWLEYCLLAAVAICAGASILFLIRRKKKGGCSGCCADCAARCTQK